ncbi:hypothetical protein [Mycobacterium sp. 48b]|uniref:hypothetical protein n=1 Tax=Mycobacterium sp. 48b TaxID=3400426 RepID=UPI003AAF4773
MSIIIRWSATLPRDGSIEVSGRELDIMVANGVDVTDEFDVAEFYKSHLGKEVDGYYFPDAGHIFDDWETQYDDDIEFEDWSPEGEAPDQYWPELTEDGA